MAATTSRQAPLIPLSDGAGEVVAAGSAVMRFTTGDLVCPVYLPEWISGLLTPRAVRHRLGGPHDRVLAERLAVHEEAAVRAPRHLVPEEAATLPASDERAGTHLACFATCIHGGPCIVASVPPVGRLPRSGAILDCRAATIDKQLRPIYVTGVV